MKKRLSRLRMIYCKNAKIMERLSALRFLNQMRMEMLHMELGRYSSNLIILLLLSKLGINLVVGSIMVEH